MTSSLTEGTACLVCIGPLVIVMPALAANFLTAVGQLPWCLQELFLCHKVIPIQSLFHTNLLAKIAVDTKLRLIQQLLFLLIFVHR